MNKVKQYIKACHTCLKAKPKYKKNRPVYGRIPVDYTPMQDLSIDIKHMPMAFGGYQYLLVIMLSHQVMATGFRENKCSCRVAQMF